MYSKSPVRAAARVPQAVSWTSRAFNVAKRLSATAICCCARSRSDLSRVADDHPKIDGVAHGSVAGPVGVNLFAGPARRGIRLEFGAQLARSRVGRDGVEIDHAVEDAGRADEAVELLALRVEFGRAVRRTAGVAGAGERGNDISRDGDLM